MEQMTLTTPTLLFSAISLIMLAYTNRFLAYAALVRDLRDKYLKTNDAYIIQQIKNIMRRVYLTRSMQILGIGSLLLCVATMFLIYVGQNSVANYVFGVALLLLIGSLAVLILEIQISVKALEVHLKDAEKHLNK